MVQPAFSDGNWCWNTIRMQNSLFEGTTNPDIFNLGKLPKIFRCRVKAHLGSLMPKINKTTMCVGLFLKTHSISFFTFWQHTCGSLKLREVAVPRGTSLNPWARRRTSSYTKYYGKDRFRQSFRVTTSNSYCCKTVEACHCFYQKK